MQKRDLKQEGTQRAYSMFTVKGIDEDARTITGIATTPEPDRYGDVVDPKGAKFKLPIPLLWQHKRDQPIGHVVDATVTDKGITVVCQLVKIDEPGKLKDRLDEAWQSIKHGLVRAFSIGFDPIEYSQIKDTWSYHFLEWDWLELSAVTLPANADCDIQTVKSIDTKTRAALGHTRPGAARLDTTPAGATAKHTPTSSKGTNVKTLQEQIAAFVAKQAAAQSRMQELMTKAAEEGVTLDKEQADEYDGLEAEVKEIDKHLARLKSLEAIQVAKGSAATVQVAAEPSAVQVRAGAQIRVESLEKGIAFARYAKCLALGQGRASDALEIAKAHYPEMKEMLTVLKAAVAAGSTTDSTWAGNLVEYNLYVQDFIEYLRPLTIVGKFGQNGIPELNQVPFNIEVIRQTGGGQGYWVGEGKPKPLTTFGFDRVNLRYAKVGNIAVLTKEQVRFSNPRADALVREALANALIAKIDSDFLNPSVAGVANVSPASLTYGMSPASASGVDADAVRADVAVLVKAFLDAGLQLGNGVWVMTQNRALRLSLMRNALGQKEFPDLTMRGGTFEGMPVIVSQYLPNSASGGDIVVLMDSKEVYMADDGTVTIDASDQVSLEMNDAPTQNGLTGGGASLVSTWQAGLIAMKAERFINWSKRRSAALAYVDNVHWGE